MTDDVLTPAQMFAARNLLRWDRRTLAKLMSLKLQAIRVFEVEGRALDGFDVQKARAALEAAGVEFITDNGGGAGVRLRMPK